MSAKVLKEAGFSKNGKPHPNSTLRLNMSTRHMVCALSDREHPFNDARLKKFFAWRSRSGRRGRYSKKAITWDIIFRMNKVNSFY